MNKPAYLLLGEIMRPHGIKGELRVRMMTDYPERIAKLGTIYLSDNPEPKTAKPYQIQGMRMNGSFGLLKLHDVPDRTAAEKYRGLYVLIDMEHAVPLEEGEFYLYQLIGVKVQTEAGELLGTLSEVLETGANDVYIVKGEKYGEILIPVTSETIIKTDVNAGIVIVKLPEGLLPGEGISENDSDED